MPSSEYAVKNIRRDLEKLNLGQLKKIAKERGFDKKNATVHGNAQRRSTWVKLLLLDTPEFQQQSEKPKPDRFAIPRRKTAAPAIKPRIVQGLKRLPIIKTTTYFYKGVKQS